MFVGWRDGETEGRENGGMRRNRVKLICGRDVETRRKNGEKRKRWNKDKLREREG